MAKLIVDAVVGGQAAVDSALAQANGTGTSNGSGVILTRERF